MEVKRSWRFQASAYPDYRHARTLGVVKGGGGWKGEDRAARSYEFVRKGEGVVMGTGKKVGESSDEEEEEEEDGDEADESLPEDEIEEQGDESLDEDMHDHETETDDDDYDENGD